MPKQNERGPTRQERQERQEPQGRNAKRKQRSGPPWGSLAAVALSVAALGYLLYGSFREDKTATTAAPLPPAPAQPEGKPAELPSGNTNKPSSSATSEWNDGAITWLSYEAGMAKAKAENKPVCLVFYTGWCPHCRNYAHVFQDPKIIEKSREFVMIRLNADDEEAVSARHAPDGTYVPRTFFLASDGSIMTDVHDARPRYLYFYDEHNPAALLAGMEAALRKAARPM